MRRPLCPKCLDSKTCVRDTDCLGGSCDNKVCKTPNCSDGTTNGLETDVDCGGNTCAKCTTGKKCTGSNDCQSGICTNQTCECPSGMAKATTQGGTGTFCIDSAEVTKGQYQKFMDATSGAVVKQGPLCTNNKFQPRAAWGPATTPPGPPDNGLAFNMSLPVHYVDWCDALAYCKWAGKQLCGKLGGGSLTSNEGNDFTKDAWYSACTNEGSYAYPYGNTYSDRCNGTGQGVLGPIKNYIGGFGYPENEDSGLMMVVDSDDRGNFTKYVHAECYGPKDAYQLSGNVAEWEDACDDPTSPTSVCRVRGGSHLANGDPAKLACNADRRVPRVPTNDAAGNALLEDVGIRCCLY
ncbi:Tryptophan synthase alpha chain [Labilithrix luteola]|uniref:Tryptophan synthase alpha chain n=1 Tax=Labilithrix luteola TaxID=1391654 RepID=A0A0K1PPC6_9BACT|nr:SUMF1/EgtB/PvdO family nonheme iron enzyme [Labilithrix luteola]AKU95378.1 Tryptophan synthase alpha chain [Labilithrix luteola]